MTVGFVVMLFGHRLPDPAMQIVELVEDCAKNGETLFLCRRLVGSNIYEVGKSRVGLIGDGSVARRMLATGVFQGVYRLPPTGLPEGIRRKDLLPIYNSSLDLRRKEFRCLVRLSKVRKCEKGTTLATLGWRTLEGNSIQVPRFQGGSYFKVRH